MNREPLLGSLKLYLDHWPNESAMVTRMITFVAEHPDCFERSLTIGHVTGSAWVVNKNGTHALLTHHRKLNRWLQLGGHADGDPDVLRVALREVKEESGLDAVPLSADIFDVDIHLIPERKTEAAHFHYDVRYLFRVEGDDSFVVSEESHDLGWIPLESLGDYTNEESMRRMADKWSTMRAEMIAKR